MLNILPLASVLNPAGQIATAVGRVRERLTSLGVAHRIAESGEGRHDVLLIVTGGTEHLALAAVDGTRDPVFLLAHPERNSLPAALEILGRLRQEGRPGRIFLLNDTMAEGGLLSRLGEHLEVRRKLRGARLALIGPPSDWLVASTPTSASVEAAWGPKVVDLSMAELRDALNAVDPSEAGRLRQEVTAAATAVLEPAPGDVELAARVALALRELTRRHRLDAFTLRCFDLVMEERTTGCLGLSWLQDEGVAAGCEGDVPATLTMLWIQFTAGEPGFMANPQDVDPGARTLWLAHCTVARRLASRYALRSHFESSLGVGIEAEIQAGAATMARIGGADLGSLFVSDGQIVRCGSSRARCRTQVQVRLDADVSDLLVRPLGNHHVLSRGHWAARLREYHELFVGQAAS